MTPVDVLSAVYLVCFGVGAVMALLSVLGGVGHGGIHLGHGHAAAGPAHHGDGAAPINLLTALVFLSWFGGVGFLLHGPLGVWAWLSLFVAGLVGLVAAAAVAQFLARVVAPQSVPLDPADYRLEGQVARVSIPVRAGGVGEVIFSQAGRRRALGARASDGAPLAHGTEVVIVSVQHGLAVVEPWGRFVADRPPSRPVAGRAAPGEP